MMQDVICVLRCMIELTLFDVGRDMGYDFGCFLVQVLL